MTNPTGNIVWLASYPKSGNTWFRAFLTALLNEGEIDINNLGSHGIFSARLTFDNETDLDSTFLYDEETKNLMPEVYTSVSRATNKLHFCKIHDALSRNSKGDFIVPLAATRRVLYFVRNPLDVCISLAAHLGITIDRAIRFMNEENSSISPQTGNLNTNEQLKQHLRSWSGHIQSWTEENSFNSYVIRYEDMLSEPLMTFSGAVAAMGLHYSEAEIARAIDASSFNKLKQQEEQKRFKETPVANASFFRSGKSGGWKSVLCDDQVQSVISAQQLYMERYHYL